MIKLIENNIEINPVPAPQDSNNSENMPTEIEEEAIKNAIENESNSIIQATWSLISELNGLIATIDFDYKDANKDNIKDILESVINDLTIDIGMMYKVISLINEKTINLIDAGKEKAEEIIQSENIEDTSTEIVDNDSEVAADETSETEEE